MTRPYDDENVQPAKVLTVMGEFGTIPVWTGRSAPDPLDAGSLAARGVSTELIERLQRDATESWGADDPEWQPTQPLLVLARELQDQLYDREVLSFEGPGTRPVREYRD